jgi:putative ABC transport system ATP-binding protein
MPLNEAASAPRGFRVTVKGATCRRLSKTVLDAVDEVISPGEFVAVIGENGAGKSSLLAAIAGELELTGGEVHIHGQPIKRPVNRDLDAVGIVHQEDECDFILDLSIEQNISIRELLGKGHTGKCWGVGGAWRRHTIDKLQEHAPSLESDFETLLGNLSGGERQLLNVALAMHIEHRENPCKLLLLDEHTAKLDHVNARLVMEYTVNQIKEVGCTAIMVTHRYGDVVANCHRALVMKHGKIKKRIPRDELKMMTEAELAKIVEIV